MIVVFRKTLPTKLVGVPTDLGELQKMDSSATDSIIIDKSEMVVPTKDPLEVSDEALKTIVPTREGKLIQAIDALGVIIKDPVTQGTTV